jgi:DNA-binding NarL/FixJ family response regulator
VAQIRILIADDHELVRLGIRSVLSTQPDFLIVSEASDGVEAIANAKQYQPDVILLDLSMPQLNGLAATPVIKEVAPNTQILIVTDHESPAFVRQAFTAGASGFLPKADLGKELVMAVRKVNAGGSFLSERMRIRVNKFVPTGPPLPSTAQD